MLSVVGSKNRTNNTHCVKSVRIRRFSGLYFPAFGLYADQKNSEYGLFSGGDSHGCTTSSHGTGISPCTDLLLLGERNSTFQASTMNN